MMYLLAEKSDLKDLIPCAKAFHEVYDPKVEFSEKAFISYWEAMLDSGQGFIIFVEHKDGDVVGGVGGVVTNFMTSDILNCVEMMWWVEPEFRGEIGLKLYNEFEAESKRRGAKRILMAAMDNSMSDKLDKFYRKRGYAPWEHHYIKEVE